MKPAPALSALLALALAACGPETPGPAPADAPTAAAAEGPARLGYAALEGDGFTPANPGGGESRKVPFGEGEAEVIAFLTRLRGGQAPTRSSNAECPSGPLTFADWGDGFQLAFADGRFAGWVAGQGAPQGFSTASGVAVGSTVARARAGLPGFSLQETSLGAEFAGGGIYGLASGLEDSATVTTLWAGVSCVFR